MNFDHFNRHFDSFSNHSISRFGNYIVCLPQHTFCNGPVINVVKINRISVAGPFAISSNNNQGIENLR